MWIHEYGITFSQVIYYYVKTNALLSKSILDNKHFRPKIKPLKIEISTTSSKSLENILCYHCFLFEAEFNKCSDCLQLPVMTPWIYIIDGQTPQKIIFACLVNIAAKGK